MKYIVILILLLGISLFVSININISKSKKIKEFKAKEAEQARRHEIDKETLSKIENINTGDIEHDFNAGIDQLHNFAESEKNGFNLDSSS